MCRASGRLCTPLGVPPWVWDDEDVPTASLAVAIDDTSLNSLGYGGIYYIGCWDGVGYPWELILERLANRTL